MQHFKAGFRSLCLSVFFVMLCCVLVIIRYFFHYLNNKWFLSFSIHHSPITCSALALTIFWKCESVSCRNYHFHVPVVKTERPPTALNIWYLILLCKPNLR